MKKLFLKAILLSMFVSGVSFGADKLYVGTNAEFEPFEYLQNGEIVGFDVDLMEEIAKYMGKEIEWKNISFDGLLPALQAKKLDVIIAGMTATEERKKFVNFSQIYYESNQMMLVHKKKSCCEIFWWIKRAWCWGCTWLYRRYSCKWDRTYSRDENLFHISHERQELESPSNSPKYEDVLQWVVPLEKASDTPEYISIEFVKGIPTKLNGKKLDGVTLIDKLNEIGAKHGIGVIDLVENRLVGMKSRGVYETPGGTILYFAHEELERLCLDRDTLQAKMKLSYDMAKLIYNGQWFTKYRKALSAFVEETQEYITGVVHLKLYKGNIVLNGMDSEYSLYSQDFSTFDEDNVYNQKDAEGFINLFGLPIKIESLLRK